MSYKRHSTIDHYLNKVRKRSRAYTAEILGKDILIHPNVMSPLYDRSAQMYIKMLPSQRDKKFLEVGVGTGVVSVFVAAQKPKEIVALDINPAAVRNAKANFKKHNVRNAKVFQSDLFAGVSGRYDTIFFNAPYHGNKPKDMLERGTSDYNYKMLRSFLSSARNFLNSKGKIFLGLSDMTDLKLFKRLVKMNSLKILQLKTKENGNWTAHLYTLVGRDI